MINKNLREYDEYGIGGLIKALPFPKTIYDIAFAAKRYLELVSGKYPNLCTDIHKYNFFIALGYTDEQWKKLNEMTIFEIVDTVEAAFGKNGPHSMPIHEMDITQLYPKFYFNKRRERTIGDMKDPITTFTFGKSWNLIPTYELDIAKFYPKFSYKERVEKTMDDMRDPITTITDKIMAGKPFNMRFYESDVKAAKYYLELYEEMACREKLTYSEMRDKFIQAGFTIDQWHKFVHTRRGSIIDFLDQVNAAYDLTSKLGLDFDGDVFCRIPITSDEAIKLLIPNTSEENKAMKTYEIKNVIFNEKATVVFWTDGTKTVVRVLEGEKNDPEKGLAMAIVKKTFGNKGNYYDIFKQWLPKTDLNVISNGEITEVTTQQPDETGNKYFTEMTVKEFCRAKKLPAKTVYNMIKNVEVNARKNKSGKWLIMVEN